jgi:hypothetical protein
MSPSVLEQQLDKLEYACNAATLALSEGDPAAVQAASATLQQLAVDVLQLVNSASRSTQNPESAILRIRALSNALPALRENLLRRSAYVDQALALVIPSMQKTTYAKSAGIYGAAAPQSGTFRGFRA